MPKRTFRLASAVNRRQTPDDDAQAAAIARELDGLALALEQAAAYVEAESLSFAEYLQDWEAKRKPVALLVRPSQPCSLTARSAPATA